MKKFNILIIAHARFGKDTMAEVLRDEFGLSFLSSSEAALDTFLFKVLNDKYQLGYKTRLEAFEDRVNHRPIWKDEISAYNDPDPHKLARHIMSTNDIYVGMRDPKEISRDIFDIVVWVDASKRLPPEPSTSMLMTEDHADVSIDNNGTLEEFKENIRKFAKDYLNL